MQTMRDIADGVIEDVISITHDGVLKVIKQDENDYNVLPSERARRVKADKKFLTIINRFIDSVTNWRRDAILADRIANKQ